MNSKRYFDDVSNQWDTIRQTFFSDNIREKMCEVAEVKMGETAVDIGAGTGFVTQELFNRKLRVIAVDQSQEMLDVLEQKFGSDGQIICLQADAYTLPLESESVDYVMANMFLHHVENPGRAIIEMIRILKPGGKVVITDLDRHNHEFLRTEQFDVWLGFERSDIRDWLANASLSDIRVDDLNEECCCDSCESCDSAAISIFIASAEKPLFQKELPIMKKMKIFEPAMCCPTGLCGVGVDPELLRISTVLDTLKKQGAAVDRFNLNSAPTEFITDQTINAYINEKGPEGLPAVMVDGAIIITGRYPTNEEFVKLLDLPESALVKPGQSVKVKISKKSSGGCDCKGGGCC